VATDLAPEFGRDNVYQLKRVKQTSVRHALPATLGGKTLCPDLTYFEANARLAEGYEFRVSTLTEEFRLADWRETLQEAHAMAELTPGGRLRFLASDEAPQDKAGVRILSLTPARKERKEGERREGDRREGDQGEAAEA
jgi:hypothetical protein